MSAGLLPPNELFIKKWQFQLYTSPNSPMYEHPLRGLTWLENGCPKRKLSVFPKALLRVTYWSDMHPQAMFPLLSLGRM
jgi:hypothetical protein